MIRKIIIAVIVFTVGFLLAVWIFGKNIDAKSNNFVKESVSADSDESYPADSEKRNSVNSEESVSADGDESYSADSEKRNSVNSEEGVSAESDESDSDNDDSCSAGSEESDSADNESLNAEIIDSSSEDVSEENEEKYAIYFDGEYDWFDTYKIEVAFGKYFHTPPSPMKEGYDFLYWVDELGNKYYADKDYIYNFHTDIYLEAVFD